MRRTSVVAQAILWAVAILASAVAGASAFVAIVLLPSLAAIALLLARPRPCSTHHRSA